MAVASGFIISIVFVHPMIFQSRLELAAAVTLLLARLLVGSEGLEKFVLKTENLSEEG